jgi:hypothetical protein
MGCVGLLDLAPVNLDFFRGRISSRKGKACLYLCRTQVGDWLGTRRIRLPAD